MRAVAVRYPIVLLAVAATGCAGAPESESDNESAAPVAERCAVEECFRPRQVRRVEVLDDENLLVYTGARECPFRVEVRGFACRLDFALDINFLQRAPGAGSIDGNAQRYSMPPRVCAYTPRVELYTGIFDPARREPVGSEGRLPGEDCRVVGVESLTDDELLELLVERRLAPPPPPTGSGELDTPEQSQEAAGSAAPEQPAPRPENGE